MSPQNRIINDRSYRLDESVCFCDTHASPCEELANYRCKIQPDIGSIRGGPFEIAALKETDSYLN